MTLATGLLALGLGVTAYTGFGGLRWIWRRTVCGRSGEDAADHLPGVWPLWIYLIAMSVVLGVAKGHYGDWDAARLAVSVAWARGLPVYAGLSEGAVQTTMYPPVWLLAYAPVAWGRTPTEVMAIGYALAPLLALLPIAVTLAAVTRSWWLSLAGLFLFTAAAVHVEPLWWSCFFPHADAPALGLGLIAVLLVYDAWRRDESRAARGLVVAGAAAACLSVGAKQVMILLLPILLGGLWIVRARRLAGAFILGALGAGLLLAAWAAWAFDISALWLNLVAIPGGASWVGAFPFNLFGALRVLMLPALPPLMLIVVMATASAMAAEGATPRPARRLLWPWLLAVGVGLSPMAVMGYVKVGGALNSLSFSLYFVYAAAVVQILETAPRGSPAPAFSRAWPRYRAGGVALTLLIAGPWMLGTLQELRYGLRTISASPCQQAYDYLRTEPDVQVYFPAYPLAHLLAEDQWYHFVLAMVDREHIGGVPMTPEHRRRHWPADPGMVAWTARQFATEHGGGGDYFPDHQTPIAVPGLPAFRCFVRMPPPERRPP